VGVRIAMTRDVITPIPTLYVSFVGFGYYD